MHDNDQVDDFKEFKTDAAGKKLRYKILIKDCAIKHVLYNQGRGGQDIKQIKFTEHRVSSEVYLTSEKTSQGCFYLGKVCSFPTGIVACADLVKLKGHQPIPKQYEAKSHCTSRSFEELPGHVDFECLSLIDSNQSHTPVGNVREAHSICTLKAATEDMALAYEKVMQVSIKQREAALEQAITSLASLLEETDPALAHLQDLLKNA